jgi:hypothetical protein
MGLESEASSNAKLSCNADYNGAMNMLKRLWLHTYGGAELIVSRTRWDEAMRLTNRESPTLVVGNVKAVIGTAVSDRFI